jgi:lysine-specific permease
MDGGLNEQGQRKTYKGYDQRSTINYGSEKIEYDSSSQISDRSHHHDMKVEPGSLESGDASSSNVDMQDGTQRGLKTRHIQMIALGGCIG